MSLFSALVLILRDEYTEEEYELNKWLLTNCMDLVIADERSDKSRAMVPTEVALERFYNEAVNGQKYVKTFRPTKIGIEVIEDDVRQPDKGIE